MLSVWQEKVAEARLVRDRSLPPDTFFTEDVLSSLPVNVTGVPGSCGKLSLSELEITERYDATQLLELLRSRTLTAREVLSAYMRRAAIAQHLTNCLTELLSEAYEAADACDEYFKTNGRPIGPLHGLPVSVKEQFSVGGHHTNASLVALIDNVTDNDCDLVQSLKALGAVIFARTMQPQLLMHLETANNIYGVCVNPFDRTKTSGGSSGGEAVLLAMKGTPLGFGGDIGGSIRCPAAFNDTIGNMGIDRGNQVYGFKPTASLISPYGVTSCLPGADSIVGSLGPFTRSKRDLDLVLSAYSSSQPWIRDPGLIPYKFDTLTAFAGKKLKIGILNEDGIVPPSDSIMRVSRRITDKLRRSPRVELVPFTPFDHSAAWSILQSLYFEGCEDKLLELLCSTGEPLHPLTKWILQTDSRDGDRKAATALEQQKFKVIRDKYRRAYSDHWNASMVDVILSPVGPDTAPPHDTSKYWNYTAVWNLLDYPALSFPASSLLGGSAGDRAGSWLAAEEPPSRQAKGELSPLPVGLQLIGKRLMDNELLAALSVIEEIIRD